ncbi:UPF0223 family protein [Schleiferilactobacillus perolens]|uniref:Uncharacterized protein n=1 Tax=Schleiferilactobacillus perolens DSM 12744 TaxID=1423792 RepID=A0A0R1NCZ0_9LACO|nr:hypothetical protein FD09_GL001348 [Schleiferilactobacillus perolens DSM 12744]
MSKVTPNYSYPLRSEWRTDEIITVMAFYNAVEAVYEKGFPRKELLAAYQAFKEVVPDKMTEKQLDAEFNESSGYSLYRAMQAARMGEQPMVHLKGGEPDE